jgi:hypothetical protein
MLKEMHMHALRIVHPVVVLSRGHLPERPRRRKPPA